MKALNYNLQWLPAYLGRETYQGIVETTIELVPGSARHQLGDQASYPRIYDILNSDSMPS